MDLEVKGTMIIPCAITLKPTKIPYNIEINGTLNELLDEIDEKFTNILDIFPIIWENILMEIPMRVVSPDLEDIELLSLISKAVIIFSFLRKSRGTTGYPGSDSLINTGW